ncbi:MAG: hypothetical protein G8345_07655 [Magnetococcales bacterium]|nr:substrate-binding domain-containing protein [Magnetococcales bacterium]NGZ26750.1 hypothetical protein [Magnetococcales bacterium]
MTGSRIKLGGLLIALMISTSMADSQPLRGPAFSDPSRPVAMDFEWTQRPIVYDLWAKKEKADLAVSLDQQLYSMLADKIRAFAVREGITIALQEGTCGISGGMLMRKQVDMVGLCCPPGDTDRMPGIKYHTLGIASLAFVVNRENPLENISLQQLRRIFQGEFHRWSDVDLGPGINLPDWPIHVIGRLHCKLRPGHWRLLLDNGDLFSPRMQEVGTIPDMLYQVVSTPGGIGYESLFHAGKYGDKGTAKPIKVNGADPFNVDDVASLRYPLYRVFSISTWEGEHLTNPHAKKLLDFLMQEADAQNGTQGFISPSWLRKNGWQFMDNELVGEPLDRRGH